MEKAIREFKVPGVVWVFLLMGVAIAVAWYFPQYAVLMPVIFAAISWAINQFAPEDGKIKELLKIVQDLVLTQPPARRGIRLVDSPEGSPRAPDESVIMLAPVHTMEEAEAVARGSKVGKVLWG